MKVGQVRGRSLPEGACHHRPRRARGFWSEAGPLFLFGRTRKFLEHPVPPHAAAPPRLLDVALGPPVAPLEGHSDQETAALGAAGQRSQRRARGGCRSARGGPRGGAAAAGRPPRRAGASAEAAGRGGGVAHRARARGRPLTSGVARALRPRARCGPSRVRGSGSAPDRPKMSTRWTPGGPGMDARSTPHRPPDRPDMDLTWTIGPRSTQDRSPIEPTWTPHRPPLSTSPPTSTRNPPQTDPRDRPHMDPKATIDGAQSEPMFDPGATSAGPQLDPSPDPGSTQDLPPSRPETTPQIDQSHRLRRPCGLPGGGDTLGCCDPVGGDGGAPIRERPSRARCARVRGCTRRATSQKPAVSAGRGVRTFALGHRSGGKVSRENAHLRKCSRFRHFHVWVAA